jgi:hypothetical protein
MNKLIIALIAISLFSCKPGGNKAILPVEQETHHKTEPTQHKEKTDSLTERK